MGKEHRPARLAIHLVSGAVLLVLAGCSPGAQPVADTPATITSTTLAPTDPSAIAPGEPEVGPPPPAPASAQAMDNAANPLPPESLSPHDADTPATVTSTTLAPTDPPAIAPGEPGVGPPPPPPASAQAIDNAASPLPPESLSPHDMELMKQSVIADWRLSRDRRLERQTSTSTAAAQAEPAAPPPSPANEQAPPVPTPAQPAQSAGPIPCSMLPATATPCMRQ